jgi:hypothetical protein
VFLRSNVFAVQYRTLKNLCPVRSKIDVLYNVRRYHCDINSWSPSPLEINDAGFLLRVFWKWRNFDSH